MNEQDKELLKAALNNINRMIDSGLTARVVADQAYNSITQRLTKLVGVKYMASVMSKYTEVALAKYGGYCEICREDMSVIDGVCLGCSATLDQFDAVVEKELTNL